MKIRVETPSRLHFGILNLQGNGFCGGIGIALEKPRVVVEASERGGVRILESIPEHVGLGAGTQMRMALEKVKGKPKAKGNPLGKISRIGEAAFEKGGFIVDCCGRVERFEFPKEWVFVIAVPEGMKKVHGRKEKALFAKIKGSGKIYAKLLKLLEKKILPALKRNEIRGFGKALTEYNRASGGYFAGEQGGKYRKGATALLVGEFLSNGAAGAGQSSWGPAAFGLVGERGASALALKMKKFCKEKKVRADVFISKVNNRGARVVLFK